MSKPTRVEIKPTRVEIVQARSAGVKGYASVARGTGLGNPYKAIEGTAISTAEEAVKSYGRLFRGELGGEIREIALRLLERDWPEGVVLIGCPCNGAFKGLPCHATVIKHFLETQIRQRERREGQCR